MDQKRTFRELAECVNCWAPGASEVSDLRLETRMWLELAECRLSALDPELKSAVAISKRFLDEDYLESAERAQVRERLFKRLSLTQVSNNNTVEEEALVRLVWVSFLKGAGLSKDVLDLMLEVSEEAKLDANCVDSVFRRNLTSWSR